ncbi:hypothetical protein psyc5s11_18470 [Clostridium gelidum]|uniref:Uncharacterized protein n=1 Tax=Clostridium gelidum TaxID=704125 RepID=A0ABN6IU93_9CLOT|nr:hypothetical protein [Clostridium gelidum]BCZ45780.1 hypothetical protein psyc5s11_18470 [Clostridium gelidum]
MKNLNKLSQWIKLLIGGLLPISYDFFHVNFYLFIAIFIAIEMVMIAFDVFLQLKVKRKISMDIIIIYIFYNWIAARIIYYF